MEISTKEMQKGLCTRNLRIKMFMHEKLKNENTHDVCNMFIYEKFKCRNQKMNLYNLGAQYSSTTP